MKNAFVMIVGSLLVSNAAFAACVSADRSARLDLANFKLLIQKPIYAAPEADSTWGRYGGLQFADFSEGALLTATPNFSSDSVSRPICRIVYSVVANDPLSNSPKLDRMLTPAVLEMSQLSIVAAATYDRGQINTSIVPPIVNVTYLNESAVKRSELVTKLPKDGGVFQVECYGNDLRVSALINAMPANSVDVVVCQ